MPKQLTKPDTLIEDPIQEFIDRVNRLEKRYKGDRYADAYLMPRSLMVALRDEIEWPSLFREMKES